MALIPLIQIKVEYRPEITTAAVKVTKGTAKPPTQLVEKINSTAKLKIQNIRYTEMDGILPEPMSKNKPARLPIIVPNI